MSSSEACCTCAALLSSIPPTYDEKTEKPAAYERRLECCNRVICPRCTTDNPRFTTYCPYCQHSTVPSPLNQSVARLSDMSALGSSSSISINQTLGDETPIIQWEDEQKAESTIAPDVLHFVDPVNDSISALSLRYGVPARALRQTNSIFSDNLLAARRTVLIPGEYYKAGVSLSPRPIEGEEEETRKGKIRKWMVACKESEYDLALLYLGQSNYDLEAAVESYKADDMWEKKNPLETSNGKGKARPGLRGYAIGGSLTGQLTS